MEKIKIDKLKERIKDHLIVEGYNLHQGSDNPDIFTVYTPYDKNFIISFYSGFVLISVLYDFGKLNISKKKILKLVNDLNTLSLRMKFSVDHNNVILVQARLQKVYNKKAFQRLLDDIAYDISTLLNDEVEKYL